MATINDLLAYINSGGTFQNTAPAASTLTSEQAAQNAAAKSAYPSSLLSQLGLMSQPAGDTTFYAGGTPGYYNNVGPGVDGFGNPIATQNASGYSQDQIDQMLAEQSVGMYGTTAQKADAAGSPYDNLIGTNLTSYQIDNGLGNPDSVQTYYNVPGYGSLLYNPQYGNVGMSATTNAAGEQGAYGLTIDPATGQVTGSTWNTQLATNPLDYAAFLGAGGLVGGAALGAFGGAGATGGGSLGANAATSAAQAGAADAAAGGALAGEFGGEGAAGAIGAGGGLTLPTAGTAAGTGLVGEMGGEGAAGAIGAGGGLTAETLAAGTGMSLSQAAQFIKDNPWIGPLVGGAIGAIGGSQDQTATTTGTQTNNSTTTSAPSQVYLDAVNPQISLLRQYASSPAAQYGGTFGTAAGTASQNSLLPQVQDLINQSTTTRNATQNAQMDYAKALIDQATQGYTAAQNPYATANNPYTQALVQNANNELTRAYNSNVAPKFSSGSSFGSSGLGFAEVSALNDLQKNLANQANSLLYNDYSQAAGLQEQYAARQDAANAAKNQASLYGANLIGNLGQSDARAQDSLTALAQQLQSSGAGILGNLGESYASRLDSMFNQNANRSLTAQQLTWNEFARQQQDALNRVNAGNAVFGVNLGNTTTNNGTTNTSQSTTAPGNVWTGAVGGALLGGQATGLFSGGLFGK